MASSTHLTGRISNAWTSLGIFSLIALLSIISFIFKNKNFSIIAKSLAPSGFVFNIIALVTGSIWGKPTWGSVSGRWNY